MVMMELCLAHVIASNARSACDRRSELSSAVSVAQKLLGSHQEEDLVNQTLRAIISDRPSICKIR